MCQICIQLLGIRLQGINRQPDWRIMNDNDLVFFVLLATEQLEKNFVYAVGNRRSLIFVGDNLRANLVI